jgi:dUTP pyrophosphatase
MWTTTGENKLLQYKKLDPRAVAPTCAHPGEDLAYDLYALEDTSLIPGKLTKVKTGIVAYFELDNKMKFRIQFGLIVRDRSSMAIKGITTSGGVIDAGYRDELVILMTQNGDGYAYEIKAGDKIAQVIPTVVYTGHGIQEVEDLPQSMRGTGGFGSTGK